MTLVDRPLIQYAIDEARAAGIKEFIFVTSRGKSALEDYFDTPPNWNRRCAKRARPVAGSAARYQHGQRCHRLCAPEPAAGPWPCGVVRAPADRDEPFAVLLPDDVIAAEKPCLQQMVEAYAETGGNMVAAMEVPPERRQPMA
jgi:UTP--glucose-1-phosphate uridylyltransferase